MANQNEERRANARRQRERQYEIDRLTAQYAEEYRAGRAPHVEEYVRQRPEFTTELLEFAVYFHTVGAETEAIGASAESDLSLAAQLALKQISTRRAAGMSMAASGVASAPIDPIDPIEGLVKQGARVGYSPRSLAEAVGLTTILLGKLEARAIAAASIPPTLVGRLATALKVAPEAIARYLGVSSQTFQAPQADAFYYAEEQPTQHQETFLDAIQSSALSPENKRAWAEIVEQDAAPGA